MYVCDDCHIQIYRLFRESPKTDPIYAYKCILIIYPHSGVCDPISYILYVIGLLVCAHQSNYTKLSTTCIQIVRLGCRCVIFIQIDFNFFSQLMSYCRSSSDRSCAQTL